MLISSGAAVGAKNKQGNMPHDLAGTSERKFETKKRDFLFTFSKYNRKLSVLQLKIF